MTKNVGHGQGLDGLLVLFRDIGPGRVEVEDDFVVNGGVVGNPKVLPPTGPVLGSEGYTPWATNLLIRAWSTSS
jgi:hypothetical protein